MIPEIEIILIEDNLDDAMLTTRALKGNKVANEIFHLRDGEMALNYFFEEDSARDVSLKKLKLVLLDLKMPKVDGLEVLRELKSHVKTKHIPVVILTSSAEDPDIQACYDLGANSYIVKPVDFDTFHSTVAQLGSYWTMINTPPLQ